MRDHLLLPLNITEHLSNADTQHTRLPGEHPRIGAEQALFPLPTREVSVGYTHIYEYRQTHIDTI